MLEEQDKQRLLEEETFRFEVRKSLENKLDNTLKGKLWKFLNSTVGLWVLSTVVVGFVVNSYANLKEKNAALARNQEVQRKLEIEISNRVKNLKFELKNLYAIPDVDKWNIEEL